MDTFKPISETALRVFARLAAKRKVTEQLRAEGRRVSLTKPSEIDALAQAYIEAHPELREQAIATAWAIAAKDQHGRMSKWLFDDDRRSRKWSRRQLPVCDRV